MTRTDDDEVDALMRLVGDELERRDDRLHHQSERLLAWLACDLRAAMGVEARARDVRDAELFARRAAARLSVRRAERRLPRRELRQRDAPITATVAQSLPLAAAERCATLLEMAAAAGAGRELWDEPCDTWVELPGDVPSARYVALRVAGDSMLPVLSPRDVILVRIDAVPVVDDLVVARLPDDGFVVKRVASLSGGSLELASFNPAYDPIVVGLQQASVLGTVIARFSRPS